MSFELKLAFVGGLVGAGGGQVGGWWGGRGLGGSGRVDGAFSAARAPSTEVSTQMT